MLHNENNLILKKIYHQFVIKHLKFNKILIRNKVLPKKAEGMYTPLAVPLSSLAAWSPKVHSTMQLGGKRWDEPMNLLLPTSKRLCPTVSSQTHLKGKVLYKMGGKECPMQQSTAIYVTKPGHVECFSTDNFTCSAAWNVSALATMQPGGLSSNYINKKLQKQMPIARNFF